MPRLRKSFFNRSVHEVAPDLIGATLLFDGVGGIIVEVEAYHHTDPAAHSYGGADRAQRRDVRPARLRLCVSLLRHPLVRELRVRARGKRERGADPRARADRRAWRRCIAAAAIADARLLCSGPGRLTEALGITRAHNALPLDAPPFELWARKDAPEIAAGLRIGITKAVDLPWRYGLKGSRFLSKPFRPLSLIQRDEHGLRSSPRRRGPFWPLDSACAGMSGVRFNVRGSNSRRVTGATR